MYLSRVKLDMNKRNTQIALSSLNRFHGAIEEAFEYQSGERERKLWRIDRLKSDTYLLILSRAVPKLDKIVQQFGMSPSDCLSKSYDILLDRIEEGSNWRFRLVANPTMCKANGKEERGKRVALVSSKSQKEWLIKQAEKNGFLLDENMFETTEAKWVNFCKRGEHRVRAISVTYEGILCVQNVEKFKNALLQGLGREKAYGMGLLTIMR